VTKKISNLKLCILLRVKLLIKISERWDSAVGIIMGYGLDVQDLIPGRARDFSLLHSVQTISEAHLDSYEMGTGDKTARA
jgi:hypothetical protein